jgi:hypothetical protein
MDDTELFKTLLTEISKLREDLQAASKNIVGWRNFDKFKDEVKNEFFTVHKRLDGVEQTCTEFKTEKEHLVDSADLLEAKHEVKDLGLSKIDFDKWLEQDKIFKKDMMTEITNIKNQSFAMDWSWCHVKKVFKLRWVQAAIVSISLIPDAILAETTTGRIFQAGWINQSQIIPSTMVLFLLMLVVIFALLKRG